MTVEDLRKIFHRWQPPMGPRDLSPEAIDAEMQEKLREWGPETAPALAEALRAMEGDIDEAALYTFYSRYAKAHPAELAAALLARPVTSQLVVAVLGDTRRPETVASLAPLVDAPFDEELLTSLAGALGTIASDDAVAALDRLEGRGDLSQGVRDEIGTARRLVAYHRRVR